jgi:hypothetical protein
MSALRPELRPIYTIDALDRHVEVDRAFVDSLAGASSTSVLKTFPGRVA